MKALSVLLFLSLQLLSKRGAVVLAQSGSGEDPTLAPYQLAQPCDDIACQLPSCHCASTDIPGNLLPSATPQIVTLNFDDSFRVYDYEEFFSQIFGDRTNPNDCPIGVTFFNTHSYTDYSLVERAHRSEGYEFASHSVTHRVPSTWWAMAEGEELERDIVEQRTILNRWGGVPEEKVRGFRAPFLQTSENQLRVLFENGFLYDASMGSFTHYWPFTLDYKSPLCNSPATCPEYSYPGLWVVPNVFYQQSTGFPCSMLDACTAPYSEDLWYEFLVDNFNLHYQTNKSPFGIHAHSAWFFLRPERVNAMNRFLDYILEKGDVYIVTQTQSLAWVQQPTPLDKIQDFEPWKCPPGPGPRCDYKAPTCSKSFFFPVYAQLRSCEEMCPVNYPALTNPLGL